MCYKRPEVGDTSGSDATSRPWAQPAQRGEFMTSFAWKRMGRGLALCAALAGTAACGDGGDSGPFLIDSNFPGSEVTEANLAQDGRAFTNADESVDDIQVFWNVDGTAIVLAETES